MPQREGARDSNGMLECLDCPSTLPLPLPLPSPLSLSTSLFLPQRTVPSHSSGGARYSAEAVPKRGLGRTAEPSQCKRRRMERPAAQRRGMELFLATLRAQGDVDLESVQRSVALWLHTCGGQASFRECVDRVSEAACPGGGIKAFAKRHITSDAAAKPLARGCARAVSLRVLTAGAAPQVFAGPETPPEQWRRSDPIRLTPAALRGDPGVWTASLWAVDGVALSDVRSEDECESDAEKCVEELPPFRAADPTASRSREQEPECNPAEVSLGHSTAYGPLSDEVVPLSAVYSPRGRPLESAAAAGALAEPAFHLADPTSEDAPGVAGAYDPNPMAPLVDLTMSPDLRPGPAPEPHPSPGLGLEGRAGLTGDFIFCAECGHKNELRGKFCANCGKKLLI